MSRMVIIRRKRFPDAFRAHPPGRTSVGNPEAIAAKASHTVSHGDSVAEVIRNLGATVLLHVLAPLHSE